MELPLDCRTRSPGACAGGKDCREQGPKGRSEDRGADSRPDPDWEDAGQNDPPRWSGLGAWWSENFVQVDVSWIAQWSSRLLVDAARASLEACGTLCASIGFAAKWSYWLATAAVGVFLFQLGLWTFSWVIYPVAKHALALWRYIRGQGQWHEVAQLHGIRVFRPQWVGPAGREEWSAAYVQQEVRGRGESREPHDLLVTDGVAVARIRHGTLRGRTNRHGFKLEGEGVFSASHRYFRNQVEALDCRIHLCAQQPCGQPDEDCLHVFATAVIPRARELDLQEVAGRGPLARCATAAWFWGHAGAGAFTHLWRRLLKTGQFILCCCGCGRRAPKRRAHGGRPEAPAARRDNSETESEGEPDQVCQADSVAYSQQGKTVPLALAPCKDAARGPKVKLLEADERLSSEEDLERVRGRLCFAACSHHRSIYEGQLAKRVCAMEGCDHEAKATKGGLRLCKLHSAKEGKPGRPHEAEDPAKALLEAVEAAKPVPAEARFAPGEGSGGPREGEAAARLGRFLSDVLAGGTDEEALRAASRGDEGPREGWESLREQAGVYLPKLPKDYPPIARKALVRLLTEEAPIPWDGAPRDDPVLGLKEVPIRADDRPAPSTEAADPVTPALNPDPLGAFLRPKGSAPLAPAAPHAPAGRPELRLPLSLALLLLLRASLPRRLGTVLVAKWPS